MGDDIPKFVKFTISWSYTYTPALIRWNYLMEEAIGPFWYAHGAQKWKINCT